MTYGIRADFNARDEPDVSIRHWVHFDISAIEKPVALVSDPIRTMPQSAIRQCCAQECPKSATEASQGLRAPGDQEIQLDVRGSRQFSDSTLTGFSVTEISDST